MLPFNSATLSELIEQGYLLCQQHPTLPLRIYNYSAKTQYERYWNPTTLHCRGLVLDAQHQPIARPLPKFFNLAEHQGTLPDGMPTLYEKLDGSLILLFFYDGEWLLASRGSFTSDQAQRARILLSRYKTQLEALDLSYTYLLEVIYPENRIVVDYGSAERLVLLAAIHTATGQEGDLETIDWSDRAQTYPADYLANGLKSLSLVQMENQEGFILRWPNGFRLKYKLAEYERLHRIVTRIQAKDVWECLAQGQPLAQFLESVPDELYQWVQRVKADLENQYAAIEADCLSVFKDLGDRKATAAYFQTQPQAKVLFLMLDGRDYSQVIWRQIKPGFERPFLGDRDLES
jgi:RNA ligase